MHCWGRDALLCALCIFLLKKHFVKLFLHLQCGAALGLPGARAAALLGMGEGRRWECSSHIPAGESQNSLG